MEEEERAAQSAKLQELIRRGGPEDLQEANRLMKVMAGYDTKHKTDYRAKAAEEVSKIQQKAKLLEERLQNFKSGEKVAEGDIFEVGTSGAETSLYEANMSQELANALQSAQPKIQKMCEEESDDSEAVAKLLEINDSIHRTIERYKLIKKGDLDAASKIPKGTLGTSTGVGKTADNELSLIDFSGDPDTTPGSSADAGTTSGQSTASVQDDLLGLSIQDQDYGQGGGIALGFGANTSKSSLLSSAVNVADFWTSRCARTFATFIYNRTELRKGPNPKYYTSAATTPFTSQTKLRPVRHLRKLSSILQVDNPSASISFPDQPGY